MSWILDQKEVHMTVGSSLQMRGDVPDLKNDLQMVKAALLYADHAKLVSVPSFALLDLVNAFDVPPSDRLTFLKTHSNQFAGESKTRIAELIKAFEHANRRRYSKPGQELLRRINAAVEAAWREIQEHNAAQISELGANGIFEAVRLGLLEIYAFDSFFYRVTRDAFSAAEIEMEYITAVSDVVSDAHTYPLFDEETSDIISSRIATGVIPISRSEIDRSREVALAADLLSRLPLFEHATIKEILDIRRELEKPLRHFRAAMIKFSNSIRSASWDKDFARDADKLFRSEVAPAVLALEDEEKSSSFLNKLTVKVAEKSIQVGGAVSASAAISALAIRMLNLPLVDVAALSVGPAIVAGSVVYSAYQEWKAQQQTNKGNSLFFYYKAGSLFENRSFEYEGKKQT